MFRWLSSLSSSEASTSYVPSTGLIIGTTAIATVTLFTLGKHTLWPLRGKVLPSPLRTVVPRMKKEDLQALVYRPDTFPGARDVETPYGSVRVYEFGPEDGEKVLFVHGISTSCITLIKLAAELAKRNYRVMLFDLFGRGFTDGVGDLPHDTRLYSSQMLSVLASSPLSWTGKDAFHLVGYSLGGGIAVNFARYYGDMVKTLVLLAPAGLIRPESFGRATRFIFSSGLVPERLLAYLTQRRLQTPIASSRAKKVPATPIPVEVAAQEVAPRPASPNEIAVPNPLEARVLTYVKWMVIHHAGFVPAFMSCILHAPMTEQHESWAYLAKRKPMTTAMFFAKNDEIIDWEDYQRDALPLAGGRENVVFKVMEGGHDFVMTQSDLIMEALDEYWA